ncbi:NAD dependent epimerase/dehydratase [Mycobacteroides abscessus subsp. abscessus]|nr:NAD dependent epimerase/dehydratase [Mycobacteroides abscessus subsp. abscessus]
MANVTIIGGHGKVALLAEPKLVQAGHTVNAVIRNADQSSDIESKGANAVVLDIQNASTTEIEKMLQETETDVLVWSAGAGGGDTSRTYAIDQDAAIRTIEAAEHTGVKRYVMVSYLGSGNGHTVGEDNGFYAYETAKAVADAYLRDSDLDFTILGPGMLTEDAAAGIEVNLKPENAETPRELVADVMVAVIADDSTIGKAIPFSAGSDEVSAAVAAAPAKRDFK